VQSHRCDKAQSESASQSPKCHGDECAVKNAGHQALSDVTAELIERHIYERGHSRNAFGDEPHLANSETSPDSESIADKILRADVAADGRNEQWKELGGLFGQGRVE